MSKQADEVKKRITIAEAVDVLEDVEHRRLSQQAVRNCCSRHGLTIGNDHKVNTAALLKARAAGKALNKASGTGELAAARLRKVTLECRRLEAEIEKVEQRQDRERVRHLKEWWTRVLSTARYRIDAARQHNLAKFPQHRTMIEEFYKDVLMHMRESGDKWEDMYPEPDWCD